MEEEKVLGQILDGKEISRKVKEEVLSEVNRLLAEGHRRPTLAVILVGEDPASAIYVNNKKKACARYGINSKSYELPASTSKDELLKLLDELNADDEVDGILLQLPLPDQLHREENLFLERINPDKDVDGFHPVSIGRLNLNLPGPRPCTPAGIMRLLEETGEDLDGKLALVIGRSNTVGKPLIQLLLQKNCTVILTHSHTKNLKDLTRQADILIASVGQLGFVTADMVKEGAIVIDVGINRLESGKVRGDVDFKAVRPKASWITKVPGGVGPMTIAMLLVNTLDCYKLREFGE
jgi:methylenetetrahydrofolate dehydrogenase (NADP+)/methenyltetrahydrofolate cyclohydrolase